MADGLGVDILVAVSLPDLRQKLAEREAALRAAEEKGISKESGAHQLLEAWLDEKPGPELEETWSQYVRSVLEELDDDQRSALKTDVIHRCREVAKASGGFLGIGEVSYAEATTIERLSDAMS